MVHSTRPQILTRWLDPALLGLVGCLYILRLYPHLWWGDEPELLTAAWCNGVAHPTGYPLYLLLQKVFFLLPLGSVAWKGHLFSSVMILVGIGFLLRLVPWSEETKVGEESSTPHPNPPPQGGREYDSPSPLAGEGWGGGYLLTGEGRGGGGISAALGWRVGILILSLAPLLRKQGMVAEVYGLSFLFAALLVYLAARFVVEPKTTTLIVIAVVAGLGFGHHRLMGFMLPGLALFLVQPLKDSRLRMRSVLAAAVVFIAATLLPYLFLLLRAQGDPPLNWEDPSNLTNLWRSFSAVQFRLDQKIVRAQEWLAFQEGTGPHPWGISLAGLWLLPGLWWSNLGLSLPVAGLGVAMLFHRSPRTLIAGFMAWLLPTLFIAQYHVADRETFHLLPIVLIGLTLAAGWAFLFEWAVNKHHLLPLPLLLVAGVLLVQQISQLQLPPEDLAGLPERYANRCLDEVPPGGVLLAVSVTPNAPVDYTYFPLLFQKEAARRGQRIALISEGFFTTPWYRGTLRREGISTTLFDALEQGTPKVPLIQTSLTDLLGKEMPGVQAASQGNSPPLAIFEVEGRYFLANRYTQGALVAETLIPSVSKRSLFFTSRFPEMEPYLKERVEWTEVFRIPMLTQGYQELDGMPIPSGKLFKARLFSKASLSPNLKQ